MRIVAWFLLLAAAVFAAISNRISDDRFSSSDTPAVHAAKQAATP